MPETTHANQPVLPLFLRWALSVPVYAKVAGIGLMVTLLFGAASLYQMRIGVARAHYTIRGEAAWTAATALAQRIAALPEKDRKAGIDRLVSEARIVLPGLEFLFVLDRDSTIVSHGPLFPQSAPSDLMRSMTGGCAQCHQGDVALLPSFPLRDADFVLPLSSGNARIYSLTDEVVIEVAVPVPGIPGGVIRLGVSDKIMTRVVEAVSRSLLIMLGVCSGIGLLLSLALSYVLVRPVHHLVQATDRVREGDFAARAPVFSGDEIGMLARAFNQMAATLEESRVAVREKEAARQVLLGRLVQAQEEERKHLARELHDELGQSLSHTLLTIESACRTCVEMRTHCCEVKADIRKLIDDVRRLAWNARPSILDDYGLDKALAQLVNETAKRADFRLDYQYVAAPDRPRLEGAIEVTLYRIAQEALTNVVRHAQASQASVVLIHHGHEVRLIVEDDGRGLTPPPEGAPARTPLGLAGMHERAALAGGQLTIDSAAGTGTTVRVKIPLGVKELYVDSHLDSR